MTPKEKAVFDAALVWALCPDAGGYRHDDKGFNASIEDTCEQLADAVDIYLGKAIRSPKFPKHWTIAQMWRRVEKQLALSAVTELPPHVHSWDGDQCHYCHIPRALAEAPESPICNRCGRVIDFCQCAPKRPAPSAGTGEKP